MRQFTKLLRISQSQLLILQPPAHRLYHTRPSIMSFETTGTIASFGGKLLKLKHKSSSTNTDMELNIFMPPQALKSGAKVPVLFYLSGLTCTANNCSEKGFFQHGAAKHGIAIVYPDTSPRRNASPYQRETSDFHQAVCKSKARMMRTTSVQVLVSTLMQLKNPGIRAIICTATSPKSFQTRFSRHSKNSTPITSA
jgi:hypothetical protein